MSDERLRALERRWQASGADEDRAAFLLEQVRAGGLSRERLLLAAHLGQAPARLALGSEAPPLPEDRFADQGGTGPDRWPLKRWVEDLAAWGDEPLMRAAAAAGRRMRPVYQGRFPARLGALHQLDTVEAWLACPCAEHRQAAERAQVRFEPEWVSELVWSAGVYVAEESGGQRPGDGSERGFAEIFAPGWRAVLEAIRAALVPWALGEVDDASP